MKKYILRSGIIALCFTAMISCRDQEEATPTQSETEVDSNPKTTPSNDTVKTTAALNPAHGQPGHRCEIPVGAPLDGSAGTVNLQQQQNTGTMDPNVSPVRLRTSTPAKNPPHGQPGHDCSIPVGADLK